MVTALTLQQNRTCINLGVFLETLLLHFAPSKFLLPETHTLDYPAVAIAVDDSVYVDDSLKTLEANFLIYFPWLIQFTKMFFIRNSHQHVFAACITFRTHAPLLLRAAFPHWGREISSFRAYDCRPFQPSVSRNLLSDYCGQKSFIYGLRKRVVLVHVQSGEFQPFLSNRIGQILSTLLHAFANSM